MLAAGHAQTCLLKVNDTTIVCYVSCFSPMLALEPLACESYSIVNSMHCFYDCIGTVIDPCGKKVCVIPCQCTANGCIDCAVVHLDVHACTGPADALSFAYRQLSVYDIMFDDRDALEEMENIAYYVNTYWKPSLDLLYFTHGTGSPVCLRWNNISVCDNTDTPAFLPLHGLVVANFHLGPTPIVFEELTDQEIADIDEETEFVWYSKSLASVAKIRQCLGESIIGEREMDTLFFYDLQ